MSARHAAFAVVALLAGCGGGGDRQGVGGVTADEAAQLNDAAEMLDSGNFAHPQDPPGNEGDADAS